MSAKTTLDHDNQIQIPLEIRTAANIKSGDILKMEIREGLIVLVPERKSLVDQLARLNAEIWKDEPADQYVRRERDSWEKH